MGLELKRPEEKVVGWKVLVYGGFETGKTSFALSLPSSIVLDSEDGTAHYADIMENVKYVVNTSSTKELMEMFDMLEKDDDLIEEMQSLVIDSKTNFYNAQQISSLELEQKRAKAKGRDEADANISVRSWGSIKLQTKKLQSLSIDLSSRGKIVADMAQEVEVTKEVNGNRVVIGYKPDLHKSEGYTYCTIIRLFREKGKKGYVYKAEIQKDRTKVFKAGDIIEGGVSYENWKPYFEKKNKGKKVVATSYAEDLQKDEEYLESEDTLIADAKKLVAQLNKKDKDALIKVLKKHKVSGMKAINNGEIAQTLIDAITPLVKE